MKQSATDKNTIIRRLRTGSIGICVFYFLLTIFYAERGIGMLPNLKPEAELEIYRYEAISQTVTYFLMAAAMLLAAILFLQIARKGMPFQDQHVRTVCIIGVLFLIIAVIPAPAALLLAKLNGVDTALFLSPMISISALLEGFLMLFIAQILHYGTMLQLESDETL